MENDERLKQLYAKANRYNEEIPMQLSKQIEVFAEILMVIGRLYASAQFAYGQAYAERKYVQGMTLAETQGTQADKHGAAETASREQRLAEARAEADLVRCKHAFIATQELIQAKKKTLELLRDEMRTHSGRGSM